MIDLDGRVRIGIPVYVLAEEYNIPKVTVHKIILGYIDYCKSMLLRGEVVDIFGIVTIVPDVITSQYNTTLAYECEKIADILGLPQHTVFIIVRAFLEDSIQSILDGKVVEFRSLVTVKPIMEGNVFTKVHSSISQLLKYKFNSEDSKITGVRVHTYKSLRDKMESRKLD